MRQLLWCRDSNRNRCNWAFPRNRDVIADTLVGWAMPTFDILPIGRVIGYSNLKLLPNVKQQQFLRRTAKSSQSSY
jgi:hypothetical protein